jgi:phenylalanyl-tRNA synthetase beta chain
MPTINVNKKRVLDLAGLKITDQALREKIPYLGTDLEEVNEKEIIVEIFPNRPDLLSEEGFARAFSSFMEKKIGLKKYESLNSDYVVNITKEVEDVRPFTACAVIKGINLDEEKINDIISIQEKLHVTYGRNRKKCAIGVYPLDAIKFPITYTALSPEKIKFVPLGSKKEMNGNQILQDHQKGKEYAYLLNGKSKFPIFIDANKEILSMPPIINSESTGKITKYTKNFFVECSGHNFETVSKALNMLVAAFSDMGGKIYSVTLKYPGDKKKTPELAPEKMTLEKKYVEKYLGFNMTEKEIKNSLEKMGYGVEIKKDKLSVLVPCYRADILHQIDLVEDVAIGYGYYNIKEDMNRPYTTGKELYKEKIKRKIREIMSGAGLIECNNMSLVNLEEQKQFCEEKQIIKIKNSVSSEFNSLKTTNIQTLLNNLKGNKQYEYPQAIFELGRVFSKDSTRETGILERELISVLICSENSDFTLAKQHLDTLFSALDLEYSVVRSKSEIFLSGRSGEIIFNNKKIGDLGELNPKIISKFELDMPTCGFELDLALLISELKKKNNILD